MIQNYVKVEHPLTISFVPEKSYPNSIQVKWSYQNMWGFTDILPSHAQRFVMGDPIQEKNLAETISLLISLGEYELMT